MQKRIVGIISCFAMMLSSCINPIKKVKVTGVEIIDKDNITISVGETSYLAASILPENASNKKVTWSIQGETASITSVGQITGLSAGYAVVTVKTVDGGFEDSSAVRVVPAGDATGIKISETSLIMKKGENKKLSATILPASNPAQSVNWTSNNNDVASVDSNGNVYAYKKGNATITAQSVTYENLSATCQVTVVEEDPASLWDESQNSLRTGKKTLDFYSFNDLHGTVEPNADSANNEPGINRLSTWLRNEKAKNPNGFVLTSSGDMWQGSADSNITKGRLVTDWMNEIGFEAMCLGNHEFDWTIDTIKSNMERSNFPLIACNIVNESTYEPVDWVKPYTTITKNGVHIGIVGAIGKGQTGDILAENVRGLKFDDPNSYINKWSNYLKQNGADVVLALIHDNIYKINDTGAQYANLIFGGHAHITEQNETSASYGYTSTSYSIPAIQAGKNGKNVGHIQLEYDFSTKSVNKKKVVVEDTRYTTISSLKEDAATKAIYDNYLNTEISAIKNEVLTTWTGGIDRDEIPNVYNNYAYKYFKDSIDTKDEYPITAVITNEARSNIPAGQLTYGAVYKALPFDNSLCLTRFRGSYISKFTSYASAHFFVPGVGEVDSSSISSYFSYSSDVYVLMIDYIATSDRYTSFLTLEQNYLQEEAMPRNILKAYLSGYPSNVI